MFCGRPKIWLCLLAFSAIAFADDGFDLPEMPKAAPKPDTAAEAEAPLNFAPIEGTISGLYIEEGDKAEDVTERYGASLYIEPTNRYLIEATSEKAFTASENRYIHC